MARDRDVRNAIQTLLVATGAFDGVWIWGLPEDYGTGASQLAAAAIEPASSTQEDKWDGAGETGLVVTSRVSITLLYRNDDPQLRDEGVEQLLDVAANALNGQNFVPGFVLPDMSRFRSWSWQPAAPPERRISATFEYQYEIDGWGNYDTTQ